MSTPHVKRSVRLPADLARRLAEDARTRRASQTAVIEAALESWLSPDAADRLEGALARRLDRMTRTIERLEWHVELGNEALAQFVRFWLITNAPLPDNAMKSAQAVGKERWQRFVETLARRMEQGPRLRSELRDDGDGREPA